MNDTDKDEENVNPVEDGENQKVDEEDEEEDEKEIEDERESEGDAGGRAWKVSRYTNGRLSYVHIKRALKLLLPRECRQKRHWASKYLPGKEQENPKHDIFKYCDIALKVTQDGKRKYRIGRVEAMESTKDGYCANSIFHVSKRRRHLFCSHRRAPFRLEVTIKHYWYSQYATNTWETR